MLLNWGNSQGLNALMNSAEFIAGFADKGSGEVDLVLSRGTGSATFTRATTATTVNSAGTIISVASGTPRSYYDPTTLQYLGYLAEGARTNLCLQSNAFTTTPWVVSSGSNLQNVTGPDGATSAWTCPGSGTQSVQQDMTLTAANYTTTFFIKKTTGVSGSFPVIRAFASPLTALCTVDTNNGTATAWTALTGGWTIQPTSTSVVSFGSFWRVSLTFLATAAVWTVGFYPAGATTSTQSSGSLGGGALSAVFYGGQTELGSFASTYIPTTTASVPRNADVLTYPTSGNVSDTVGSVYVEYSVNSLFSARAVSSAIIETQGASGLIYNNGTDTNIQIFDGTSVTAATGSAVVVGVAQKAASSWGSGKSASKTGGSVSSGAFDGSMNVGTSISIGGNTVSSLPLFGTIRNVRIYQAQLSASQLQAVTS